MKIDIDKIKKSLSEIALSKEQELKQEIKNKGKEATGKLINSVRSEVSSTGSRVDLDIYAEGYLKHVEQGRKAGKYPPVQPIKKWMAAKGIEPEALFPILNKIKKEGIAPVPITKEIKTEDIASIVAKAISEPLQDSIARTFKQELK